MIQSFRTRVWSNFFFPRWALFSTGMYHEVDAGFKGVTKHCCRSRPTAISRAVTERAIHLFGDSRVAEATPSRFFEATSLLDRVTRAYRKTFLLQVGISIEFE